MTIKVKIRPIRAPIPFEIECDLDEFKPQTIAEILKMLYDMTPIILAKIKAMKEKEKIDRNP